MSEPPVDEVPFWREPEWWKIRDDAAVSRAQLVERWADRSNLDGYDRKRFVNALGAWSSVLAGQPWVRTAIGATAAMYASTGNRNEYRDSENWSRVSWLWGIYGDRLTRYVLGFVPEVSRYRPKIGQPYTSTLREAARSVPKDVRDAMVDDDVLHSGDTLARFFEDPARRQRRDMEVAARVYAGKLHEIATKTGDPVLSEAVEVALAGLHTQLGIDVPVLGAESSPPPDRRQDAVDLFESEVTWSDALRDQFFGESSRRTIDTIEKKLIAGDVVTPLDARKIYQVKKKAVAQEQIRVRSIQIVPTDLTTLEIRDDRETNTERRGLEQRNVLEMAHIALQAFTIVPRARAGAKHVAVVDFWEKEMAAAILAGESGLGIARDAGIKALVVEQWAVSHDEAVCTSKNQAAALVSGMVRIAIAHALPELADFSEWIGRDSSTQLWADRFRGVNEMLRRYRGLNPQDIYDDPKKGEL